MKCRQMAGLVMLCAGSAAHLTAAHKGKQAQQPPPEPTLEESVQAVMRAQESERQTGQTAGSLWSPAARLSDLSSDQRGRRVGDIITIRVNENASAVSTGTVKTARNSSVQSNVASLAGITNATGPLANLAKLGTQTALNGQGTTTRDTTLTDTVSALVTRVLPNGNLVIEGNKHIGVNSENQTISVRGMVRPIDLDTLNSVSSTRIAQMEIRVNGKGIVADSVKRPFILYRLLLGLLPF